MHSVQSARKKPIIIIIIIIGSIGTISKSFGQHLTNRHELETRISDKPWTQEISKVTDWPRRRAVAEFRLCVGHDCLGAHLHCIGIRPDPYCTLCSLREPMDRNRLGQCTALSNKTECERYWEARTKMMEN